MKDQKRHQSIFGDPTAERTREPDYSFDDDEAFRRTFDDRTMKHLNSIFSSNYRQYNETEKPQKHSLVNMSKF